MKSARSKYVADLEAKKEIEEKQKQEQLKLKNEEAKKTEKKNELVYIDKEIQLKTGDLKVAEDRISEGNLKLQKALRETKLSRKDIQEAQSLIDMGIERKRKVEEDLVQLNKKRKLLN